MCQKLITISQSIGYVDFALLVSNDTMSPMFKDGDYLLVKRESILKHGQLGIFKISGTYHARQFYCKNGETKLVSLNRNVTDIPLDASVQYIGRVIDVKK